MEKKKISSGEIRQDLATGKWVIIATERAKRPHELVVKKPPKPKPIKYREDCPFCNLVDFPQEPDTLRLPDDDENWQVHIFGNKFPALKPAQEFRSWNKGPYRTVEAVGYHELLATRWHNDHTTDLTTAEMSLQLEALVLRYRQLKIEPEVNYIQIIKNHGDLAGASLEHPHLQIFTTPVLPSDFSDLLRGAEAYSKKNKREVFADIVDFELSEGDRVISENDEFVAFCPYASRVPFEITVMPKEPSPYFENLSPQSRDLFAETMLEVLRRLDQALNDPDHNYFIYSAPCDDTGFVCRQETFSNFRWHLSIFPRLGKFGGFEMASGLEINHTLPEEAAQFLRDVRFTA